MLVLLFFSILLEMQLGFDYSTHAAHNFVVILFITRSILFITQLSLQLGFFSVQLLKTMVIRFLCRLIYLAQHFSYRAAFISACNWDSLKLSFHSYIQLCFLICSPTLLLGFLLSCAAIRFTIS